MNFALDANGDIDITGGRMSLVTGIAEIEQRLNVKLRTFREEVFYDTTLGIPWADLMGDKRTQFSDVRDEVWRELAADPGVVEVERVEVAYDPETRAASIDFAVRVVDDGTSTTTTADSPEPSPTSGYSLASIMSRISLRFGP